MESSKEKYYRFITKLYLNNKNLNQRDQINSSLKTTPIKKMLNNRTLKNCSCCKELELVKSPKAKMNFLRKSLNYSILNAKKEATKDSNLIKNIQNEKLKRSQGNYSRFRNIHCHSICKNPIIKRQSQIIYLTNNIVSKREVIKDKHLKLRLFYTVSWMLVFFFSRKKDIMLKRIKGIPVQQILNEFKSFFLKLRADNSDLFNFNISKSIKLENQKVQYWIIVKQILKYLNASFNDFPPLIIHFIKSFDLSSFSSDELFKTNPSLLRATFFMYLIIIRVIVNSFFEPNIDSLYNNLEKSKL